MDRSADKCTGIPGLDHVLTQGMPLSCITLVQGPPGSGKTTFALQFLTEGVRHGGTGLYVALSDTIPEVQAFAASRGISLEGISILELMPLEYLQGQSQSFFHPGEVEIADTSRRIIAEAERLRPSRLVIDSLSELRLSLADDLVFHRQITAIKHTMTTLGVTTVMAGPEDTNSNIQTLAHGVIELSVACSHGKERRRLRVMKMRDFDFVSGYHDYDLTSTGVRVHPRIVRTGDGQPSAAPGLISSGIAEFDALLGGGIERGTTTIMVGTTGTGKSAVAIQYVMAAALRGERSHMYFFDERIATAVRRSEGLGAQVREAVRDGLIRMSDLDPTELSPGEFTDTVRAAVEADDARIVVVDSLSSYLNILPDENALMLQMHGLCSYLNRRGIAIFLTLALAGVFGASARSALTVDLSFLADAIVLFRTFESAGAVHKAVSVVKKRYGAHESTIRELILEAGRIGVGPALHDLQGVLTGTPHFAGRAAAGALSAEDTQENEPEQ